MPSAPRAHRPSIHVWMWTPTCSGRSHLHACHGVPETCSAGPCVYRRHRRGAALGQQVALRPSAAVSSSLSGSACHHRRGRSRRAEQPPLSHGGTRPARVSRGISPVFQLSSQGSDATAPKLQFNLCGRPSVCPMPRPTSQERLKSKQLRGMKVRIKAWAPSSSSASGWLCDLGQVPYPL